jgi:hypothetical protein
VSPTPSVVAYCRRGILQQPCACSPSTSPTPATLRLALSEANRSCAAKDYFFFATLRLVFLTVFFAADFVFGFAFFAILPS